MAVSKQAQQLKDLIARGKEQGYLTYAEVNDHLPNDIVDPEQIEDIVNMINDMGITVYEEAPEAESKTLTDTPATDEDAVEEAEAALASVDAEFGRTTDPVRMYMREMGTVELLTREGEIEIARRIEEGRMQVHEAICLCPSTFREIMLLGERIVEIRDEAIESGEEPNFRDIIDVDEKVVNAAAIKEYENRMSRSED